MIGIQPNSTQVPNIIIDEWLSKLNDHELRVLFIVVRQTLGWQEDPETGRRKERDWISMRQLTQKTGRGRTKISLAVKTLVEKYRLIEAMTENGEMLETAEKRRNHRGAIFYRLSIRQPNPTLFDKPRVHNMNTGGSRVHSVNTQNVNTTKETLITKENTCDPAKPDALEIEKKKVSNESKTVSVHKQFIDYWYLNTRKARRITPIITAQDGKNLQRVLRLGVRQETLEKAAIYFLHDRSFRTFSPSLSTFLSAGVITGIMNRMENEAEFWKKIESYIGTQGGVAVEPKQIASFADQLAMLKHRLAASKKMPFSTPVH